MRTHRSIGLSLSTAVVASLIAAPSAAAEPADEAAFQPLQNGVTAHRGFSAAYPENTFAAFEHGLELGVDWLELDIFHTADGRIVTAHDSTTGRFADRNLVIADSTYEELATLDVAHSYREENDLTYRDVPKMRMPLLSEVIELVMQQDRTRLSLQPKDGSTAAAVAMVQEMGAEQWIGFNDGNLAKMSLAKELEPAIHIFWDRPATADIDADLQIALDRGFESMVVNQAGITPQVIEQIQAAGLEAGAWTVNDTATMTRFIDWGIDRLYTDHPDQAMLLFGLDERSGLEHGLLGHWSFDDARRVMALDDGSPNPLRAGRPRADATLAKGGVLGSAVRLDGDGDYVDVGLEVLPDHASAYTAAAWFKPTNPAGADRQFILETSGSWAVSVELTADTGRLKYSVQTDGTSVIAESGVVPSAGEWHHVAVTYDAAGGATALYLDGAEVVNFPHDAKETATGWLAPTDGLHIGTYRGADGRFFRGAIDDVAVWNRVLSADELAEIWDDGDGTPVPASYPARTGHEGPWWERRWRS